MNRNTLLTEREVEEILHEFVRDRGGFTHQELLNAIGAKLLANAHPCKGDFLLIQKQAQQLENRWRRAGLIRFEGVKRGWVFT